MALCAVVKVATGASLVPVTVIEKDEKDSVSEAPRLSVTK